MNYSHLCSQILLAFENLPLSFLYIIIFVTILIPFILYFIFKKFKRQNTSLYKRVYVLGIQLILYLLFIGNFIYLGNISVFHENYINNNSMYKVETFLKRISFGSDDPHVQFQYGMFWIISIYALYLLEKAFRLKIITFQKLKSFFKAWKNEWF